MRMHHSSAYSYSCHRWISVSPPPAPMCLWEARDFCARKINIKKCSLHTQFAHVPRRPNIKSRRIYIWACAERLAHAQKYKIGAQGNRLSLSQPAPNSPSCCCVSGSYKFLWHFIGYITIIIIRLCKITWLELIDDGLMTMYFHWYSHSTSHPVRDARVYLFFISAVFIFSSNVECRWYRLLSHPLQFLHACYL